MLVVKGQPWEGEHQFKQLQDLWDDARDNPTDKELEQGLNKPRDRLINDTAKHSQKTHNSSLRLIATHRQTIRKQQ